MRTCLSVCFLALFCAASLAQQSSTSGQSRQDGVDQRGDHVMGFSHDLTTHHFQLLKTRPIFRSKPTSRTSAFVFFDG